MQHNTGKSGSTSIFGNAVKHGQHALDNQEVAEVEGDDGDADVAVDDPLQLVAGVAMNDAAQPRLSPAEMTPRGRGATTV